MNAYVYMFLCCLQFFGKHRFGGLEVLELLKNKEKVVGLKQTKKAAEQGRLESVIIADDADKRLTEPLKQLCVEKNITIYTTEIGRAHV